MRSKIVRQFHTCGCHGWLAQQCCSDNLLRPERSITCSRDSTCKSLASNWHPGAKVTATEIEKMRDWRCLQRRENLEIEFTLRPRCRPQRAILLPYQGEALHQCAQLDEQYAIKFPLTAR